MATSRKPRSALPKINLALQGGGAHGAFTAGALDALLEDGTLDIEGVCGASAGAMNAAVLACGWARGGRAGAREALHAFWQDVASCAQPFGVPRGFGLAEPALDGYNLNRIPAFALWNAWMQLWSPYELNPGNLNPLRDVVAAHVDEEALRQGPLKIFVTATSVRTGQARLFHGEHLSIDALMASACLPTLFQAVEIGGEAFWDGGYSGNPALWPLIYNTRSLDILLIQIDPLLRDGVPRSSAEIADRLNEISFNQPLVAEMRAIAFVGRMVEKRHLPRGYKALRMHRIAADEVLAPLDLSSKTNNDRALIERLWRIGQHAAHAWLRAHRGAVGRKGSFEIEKVVLGQG
jgi:NTE family protein